MKKLLTKAVLTAVSISLVSCGSGGGGGSEASIKIKSVEIKDEYGNKIDVVYPGDVFYIKWNVDYKSPAASGYRVQLYALSDNNVPDYRVDDNMFYESNCDIPLTACHKGTRCIYEKVENGNEITYRIGCSHYDTMNDQWPEPTRKIEIDPYQVQYIGVNAHVIYVDELANLKVKQDKKAVPFTFMP